jgi:hypothetical protein
MATKKSDDSDQENFFDPRGGVVPTKQAALAAAKTTGTATRRAYFDLYLPAGGGIFEIEVLFDPSSWPFVISGGTIKGIICGSPSWVVTGGSIGSALTINGSNVCPKKGCSTSITIIGKCQCTPSYIGTYGFNGSSNMFNHSTLFVGYDFPR